MFNYIFKKIVPGYENPSDIKVRGKCGKILGISGIILNLLLFAVKLIAGLISGSVALTVDAVNNLTDSTSSVITLVGFRLSEKPPDNEHPYGHARMEYITGILISFFILFLGLEMGITSVKRIVNPEDTNYSLPVILVLVSSILVKLFLFAVNQSVGKHIDSQTLIATGRDSLNDAVSTFVILIGAGCSILFKIDLDGWMGIFVAVFIVISGVRLIIETGNPLLGAAPPAELVKTLYNKILSYDGIVGVHDLQIHNYGAGQRFASVHCEVPAETNILISHDQIDNIEQDVLRDLNLHLVIHLDPIETQNEETVKLYNEVNDLVRKLYPELRIHDFRVVRGITHTNVVFDIAVPFDMEERDQDICKEIDKNIKQIDPTYKTVINVDRTSKVNMENME